MAEIMLYRLDVAAAAATGTLDFQPIEVQKKPAEATLYQLSRLEALTRLLEYEGQVKAIDLMEYGDFGVGAPYLLGELNVLDGKVYQALYDGTIIVSNLHQTIPFAQLVHFSAEFSCHLSPALDIGDFEAQLDQLIAPHGKDVFYAVKIEGRFPMIRCRSVHFQRKPFKSMDRIMAEDQVVTVWHDVEGTLISIYGPAFMHPVAPTGWHFHFLSSERKLGGHVLGLVMAAGIAEIERLPGFVLMLPQ